MAVLEKIRSKAVFLTVIIGVALLAFIMGDFLTSGRSLFGSGNTIAKVGDTKIDAIEFQKRYEEINLQMQNQSQKTDPSVVQQQVLEQMINEVLLNNEVEKLSISVSDQELTEAMTGEYANPSVVQFARQMGADTPAMLYDMLANPGKYGVNNEQIAEVKTQWNKLQEEVEKQLKYQKLQLLVAGAMQANKIDRKLLAEENAVTSTILFAKQGYETLKDEDFPVSDSELKAQYNKEKDQFKLDEEVRRLHYIAVNVVPSEEDNNRAAAMISEVLDSLKVGGNSVDNIRNNSELTIMEQQYRLSDIRSTEEKEFVESAAVGAVSEPKLIARKYTIYKLTNKENLVDSVNVSVVSVMGDKARQDSVLNELNAGTSLADLQKAGGIDGQENQDQMILGIADSVRTKLLNAGAGYMVLNSSEQAAFLCKVNKKAASKNIYSVAEISFEVYPSTETVDGLRDKLQDYIMQNNTAKDFEENAVKAGYQAVEAIVTPTTPQIAGLESSRKAIQWLFDAKKGSVSPIYDKENNNLMLVVALDDVYNDYMPLSNATIAQMETDKVIRDKKAEAIMAKLEGKKSLAEAAQAMAVAVDTTQVTFGQIYIPKVGMGESALTARVSVAKEGEVSAPVKGNNGVYVFQVLKNDVSQRPTTDEENNRQFATTRGNNAVMQHSIDILRAATKVKKDMMIKFW